MVPIDVTSCAYTLRLDGLVKAGRNTITLQNVDPRPELVVVMDDDLEDQPELLPKFLSKAREGFDVVYGIRKSKRTTDKVSGFQQFNI